LRSPREGFLEAAERGDLPAAVATDSNLEPCSSVLVDARGDAGVLFLLHGFPFRSAWCAVSRLMPASSAIRLTVSPAFLPAFPGCMDKPIWLNHASQTCQGCRKCSRRLLGIVWLSHCRSHDHLTERLRVPWEDPGLVKREQLEVEIGMARQHVTEVKTLDVRLAGRGVCDLPSKESS
jgi:hypothetical protein